MEFTARLEEASSTRERPFDCCVIEVVEQAVAENEVERLRILKYEGGCIALDKGSTMFLSRGSYVPRIEVDADIVALPEQRRVRTWPTSDFEHSTGSHGVMNSQEWSDFLRYERELPSRIQHRVIEQ
ncbi:hypothetical protein Spb1_17140 [Planctopirus ephydatiae]|uniref:Uncharacterized protein n=1 Tax=Planctopirus ephydatiae TaxID=2528019 RepID=A0A518GMK7_9PLAN|nr:hypothetical protein [Planctopirus ephydatiae]QDV29797.1 hypothetical protein Spb1_17140 [Planctopirus ephydatiae]